MSKYVCVMEGNISNVNAKKIKISEVNEGLDWHLEATNPNDFGGFNFSDEENILQWIRRGDTIYDVELPDGTEVIKVSSPFPLNGLFRANEIIVKNPRPLNQTIIDELYDKSNMPNQTYYIVLAILAQKAYEHTCEKLIKDRINISNIDEALESYIQYEKEHSDISSNPGQYYKYLELLNTIKKDKLKHQKYVRVMFGTESNAGGFKYKINEVNETTNWHPEANNPEDFGGFNISTEDKILRWLLRGDTIYDVEIPSDADIVECPSESTPHGVFRSNKIIVKNPRILTEDIVMDLYEKSNLPDKSYFQCLTFLSLRNYNQVCQRIIKDKVNITNAQQALATFSTFFTLKEEDKNNCYKEIFNLLQSHQKQ